MRTQLKLLGLLIVVLTAGAGAGEPETAGASTPLARHMQLHFTAAKAMRTFIIAGQLDGVPESAEWLIEHEAASGLPADWSPYVEAMREYARRARDAGHLVFASAALGQMVRTCGECHAANGVEIEFAEAGRPPSAGGNVRSRMLRHLWAVDRMWEGLIGPSDDAWNRGAAVLAETELDAGQFDVSPEQWPTLDYLLALRREVGREGLNAQTGEHRSEIYGEFLALCSDCHRLIGRGPQSPRTVSGPPGPQ